MPRNSDPTQHLASRGRTGWQAGFALVGAAVVACAVMAVLQLTERSNSPKASRTPVPAELRVRLERDDRTPILGASGTLTSASETISSQADDDGSLRFHHRGEGPARLTVEAAGFARLNKTLQLGLGQRVITLALTPGVQLDVQVVDDRGVSVADAQISASEMPVDANAVSDPRRARADATGHATLRDLAAGRYAITISAPGHESVVFEDTEAPGAAIKTTLQRTARIVGSVQVAESRLPAPATVVLAGSGVWPPRQLDVGDNGRFEIDALPGGVYELHAHAPGLVAAPVEGLLADPGQSVEVTLLLEPAVQLTARVIDEQTGQPIEHARVLVGEDSLAFAANAATTDSDGLLVIDGLQRRAYRVSIQAEGYIGVNGVEQMAAAAPATYALARSASVSGSIVDAEGHPLAGVRLEVVGDSKSGTPLMLTQGSLAFRAQLWSKQQAGPLPLTRSDNLGVTVGAVPPIPLLTGHSFDTNAAPDGISAGFISDSSGHFAIAGLPAGTVQLVAVQPNWAVSRSPMLTLSAGSDLRGVRLVMRRGAMLSGSVVDSRGFPARAMRVELACEGDPTPRATVSDGAGHFELGGGLGKCSVTAFPRDLPPTELTLVVADGERRELELAIAQEAFTLRGTVVDAGGFPVTSAAIQVRGSARPDDSARPGERNRSANPTTGSGISGADGTFEITGLGAPPYEVHIHHPNFAPLHLPRVSRLDGDRFVLPPGATLRGRVSSDQDTSGLPASRVELHGQTLNEPRITRSGSQGTFEFSNVTAGNYELLFYHPETSSKRVRWTVSARDVERGDVQVGDVTLQQAGSAYGDVVDRLGAPVPGARVVHAASSASTSTDRDGHFVLAGLPPGVIELEASHPGAGQSRGTVRVRVFAAQQSPAPRLQLERRLSDAAPPVSAERAMSSGAASTQEASAGPTAAHPGVGIEVATRGGSVVVASVLPGSTAARAGLQVDDVIATVDGEPVVVAGQVRSLLRGIAGTSLVFEVRRAGALQRIRVKREVITGP